MVVYLKPEYFQIIHYYFYSLGIFSLTIAFLFPVYTAFTILFMSFYVIHSGISWYMSWFMHKKMQQVFIINKSKYAIEHVILTVFSGAMAVILYYMFQETYEALMTSVITINFFVVFLGLLWYILGAAKISHKLFEWQEGRKLSMGRDMVFSFRKKQQLKLVDDETLKNYKFGSDGAIDQLMMEAKMMSEKGRAFSDQVKEIEVRMASLEIENFRKKVSKLEEGDVTEADRNIINSYNRAIKEKELKIMNYEKGLKKRKLLK